MEEHLIKKKRNTSGLKKRIYDSDWVPKPLSVPIEKKITTRVARPIPSEVNEQNDIANLMYTWTEENACALNLDEFCLSHGFRPYKLYKLRHSNEYFADVLYMSMSKIISRMGQEVWNKGGDSKMYTDMLRMWHENYRETVNEEVAHRVQVSAEAVAKASIGQTVYNVVDIELDKAEETDVVTKSLERDGKKRNESGAGRRNKAMVTQVSTPLVPETLD